MKRRDFLKFGSAGLAGVALGGLTRMPLVRIGNVFAASQNAWKFGVMGDTQWTEHTTDPGNQAMTDYSIDPAGDNPYSVAVSIINQIDAQFIQHGVAFVIQAGDLTDCGTDRAIAARALAAQTNRGGRGRALALTSAENVQRTALPIAQYMRPTVRKQRHVARGEDRRSIGPLHLELGAAPRDDEETGRVGQVGEAQAPGGAELHARIDQGREA